MLSDLPEAPEWLLTLLRQGKRRRTAPAAATPIVEPDRPEAIAKAVDWLRNHAPEAVEGAGGDQATYEVCARMRDFGLSEATAFDVVAEHWNEAGKAAPPWDAEDLQQKVANAYRYGSGVVGGALGVAEFDDATAVSEGEVEPAKRRKLYSLPFAAAADGALEQVGEPLIEGLFDQRAMAVVYGPSNSGKTFLALDWAYHIAAGRPWVGHETAKGAVIYVAAEGGRGILKRMAALRKHYGADAPTPLYTVPCPIDLLSSRADIADLIAIVKAAIAESGEPCRLVVIDTVSRALAGGDENTSTDMGAFVKNIDAIRSAVQASLLLVHHSGKDMAKGARGWSGLRAATDTEIEILDGKIRVSKQRDLEAVPDMSFRLDKVEIGQDAKGRTVTSCVLRVTTGNEFAKIELSGRDLAFFEAFKDAAQAKAEELGNPDRWRETPVEWHEWTEAYKAQKLSGFESAHSMHTGISRTSLQKMRASVCESGHILKTKEDQYVMG